MFGRGIAFCEVDFDVNIEGIAEGVFGQPGEEKGGCSFEFRGGRG